ncbi:chitin synthase-domain-containing protein [Obelidium mucronatum]|nr:chitin synthase-domain-containing protein [Obelidium mucronatum]
MSTPEALISLITPNEPGVPEPKSYFSIADGEKQHNMAQVYSGDYHYGDDERLTSVPIIGIVKCGKPSERTAKKPGNRGKRDSQIILTTFLTSVSDIPHARMTPLDYDIACKIERITGESPKSYSLVLMVDADTAVHEESLFFMVQAMKNDSKIMGLCGETRIENPRESWVTKIQVFEYYISHHLGKAFESMFGGVTCLPGCFSMYRIHGKALKTDQYVTEKHNIPLLIDEEISESYKEFQVTTLHKKNLLLLGEDRYLTTLMLSRFPKRRLIFVPQARCATTVPADFKTLLSQRRRWINSTIHNLIYLLQVDNLCGIFCLSMKFVILLELIGTVVLPVAVSLMFVLLVAAIFSGPSLPLYMLLITLFLPGILILCTTFEVEYIMWMIVYLGALPVWNFVLPLYSFWHFDDFSWGETRKIEGEIANGGNDHAGRHGDYEIGSVITKT